MFIYGSVNGFRFKKLLASGFGKSRFIPVRKGQIGRVNVGAARHDKLNRPCHRRSSAYWSALALRKWSRFHLRSYGPLSRVQWLYVTRTF